MRLAQSRLSSVAELIKHARQILHMAMGNGRLSFHTLYMYGMLLFIPVLYYYKQQIFA